MRVFVLGLDGLSFNIIYKMVGDAELTAINEVLSHGCKARMRSVIPPVSEPAWVSMATGLNPGKTGVIDFLCKRNRSDNRLYPINSSYYKDKAVWDLASIYELKVGVVNYPLLYPPYEVNGFMISGMGAADQNRITYPSELIYELDSLVNGYKIDIDYMNKRYDDLDRFFKEILEILHKRKKVILHLFKKNNPDLFFAVLSCTDWLLHLAWRIIDPHHPLHDKKEHNLYYEKIIKFFYEVDKLINEILSLMDKDTVLFIVSDHGFGPHHDIFNLYAWLKAKGYLVEKKCLSLAFRKSIDYLKRLWYSFRRGIKYTPDPSKYIDFNKSTAFCLGHTIPFGGIYLNENNHIEDPTIVNKLVEEISSFAKQLGISIKLYDTRKIYSGSKLDLLPRIILSVNEYEGVVTEDPLDNNIFSSLCYSKRYTGSHRLYGIFLAYGEYIRNIDLKEIKIYDVAPTILYTLELPIPSDVDGDVLHKIFTGGSPPSLYPVVKVSREVLTIKSRIKHIKKKLQK